MKRASIRRVVAGVASVLVSAAAVFAFSGSAKATSFPTYTTPKFNSFTSGAPVGDETDFVRIAKDGSSTYNNNFTDCSDGQLADVWVYIHNNATQGANGTNFDGSAVAHNVNLKVSAPFGTTSTKFDVNGRITSKEAATVNDGATINCGSDQYELQFVSNSAKIYTHAMNGVALSDAIVGNGVTIGSEKLDGVWPGCWDYVGTVQLQVKLVKKAQPNIDYSCKALTISVISDRKVQVDVDTRTTNGATVKNYAYNFGDGSAVINSANKSATYTYSKDGTYQIAVQVTFGVNGENKTVNNDRFVCTGSVKVTSKTVTPPTTIPNTGAGSMVGIFAITSALGAIAYRVWSVRRVRVGQ